MKTKFLLITFLVFVSIIETQAQYQIFNSEINGISQKRKHVMSFGINPFMMIHKGENPDNSEYYASNFLFNFGWKFSTDLAYRFSLYNHAYKLSPGFKPLYYHGVEIRQLVYRSGDNRQSGLDVIATGGVHLWLDNAGFDITPNMIWRFNRKFKAYGGFDLDINNEMVPHDKLPATKEIILYYWAPLGLELLPTNTVSINIEFGYPLSKNTHYIMGFGVKYFIFKDTYQRFQ